jgi:hypothetical protein
MKIGGNPVGRSEIFFVGLLFGAELPRWTPTSATVGGGGLLSAGDTRAACEVILHGWQHAAPFLLERVRNEAGQDESLKLAVDQFVAVGGRNSLMAAKYPVLLPLSGAQPT